MERKFSIFHSSNSIIAEQKGSRSEENQGSAYAEIVKLEEMSHSMSSNSPQYAQVNKKHTAVVSPTSGL